MADNKLTILYSRLSKEDELNGDSLSIENQKKLLEDYAIANGFTNIVHIFDDGKTGLNKDRDGFQRLEMEVDKGNVGQILVKDISRCSRNIVDITLFLEKLQEKNVRFISVSENEDSEKGLSDMLMFKSLFNEYYCRDISRKIKAIKENQAKNGKRLSGEPPYGYLIDPNDKYHLIPDPETAENVRKIFEMFVAGDGIFDIIRWLLENEILTPLALKAHRGQRNFNRINADLPYTWNGKTLYDLLIRKEYIGSTVIKRTTKVSYKSKKIKRNSEDEQYIFPNTHEPLIDEHTFEMAQKRLENRKRSTKTGYIDMYSGILFCGDCNAKMHLHGNRQKENELIFSCGTYKNAKNRMIVECSMHYMRKIILDELILADLQRVFNEAKLNKDLFIANALKTAKSRQSSDTSLKKKEYNKSKKRIAELDKIFKSLYEDKVLGKISQKQFDNLTADFEIEKSKLQTIIDNFETALSEADSEKENVRKFLKIVDKYTEIRELNYEILHEFIDKIKIFEADKETKTRKIEVFYNFIGAVKTTAPPLTTANLKGRHKSFTEIIVS